MIHDKALLTSAAGELRSIIRATVGEAIVDAGHFTGCRLWEEDLVEWTDDLLCAQVTILRTIPFTISTGAIRKC